jgi:hypothetical protein
MFPFHFPFASVADHPLAASKRKTILKKSDTTTVAAGAGNEKTTAKSRFTVKRAESEEARV